MRRFTRWVLGVSLAALSLAALVWAVSVGLLVKEVVTEPSAPGWVRANGEWLTSSSAGREIEQLADRLMMEYSDAAVRLPDAEFSNGGRALPSHRIPEKFRSRGGAFGEPEVFVRLDAESKPAVLVLSWGHLRRALLVFQKAPRDPPRGSSVYRASDRTFVVAYEVAQDCSSRAGSRRAEGELSAPPP